MLSKIIFWKKILKMEKNKIKNLGLGNLIIEIGGIELLRGYDKIDSQNKSFNIEHLSSLYRKISNREVMNYNGFGKYSNENSRLGDLARQGFEYSVNMAFDIGGNKNKAKLDLAISKIRNLEEKIVFNPKKLVIGDAIENIPSLLKLSVNEQFREHTQIVLSASGELLNLTEKNHLISKNNNLKYN